MKLDKFRRKTKILHLSSFPRHNDNLRSSKFHRKQKTVIPSYLQLTVQQTGLNS